MLPHQRAVTRYRARCLSFLEHFVAAMQTLSNLRGLLARASRRAVRCEIAYDAHHDVAALLARAPRAALTHPRIEDLQ